MSLRDLILFLFKWKMTIIGVIIGTTGLVIAFAYLMPPGYGSSASVLIERTGVGAGRLTYAPNQDMIEVLNTEAVIVTSRPVMESVVDTLALDQIQSTPKGMGKVMASFGAMLVDLGLSTEVSAREKWIERLQRQTRVEPGTQSNVLTISYNSQDPAFAQRVLAVLVDAYIERHRQIYSSSGLSAFYQSRLTEVEERLAGLRAELLELRQTDPAENPTDAGLADELTRLRSELGIRTAELVDLRTRFLPGHQSIVVAQRQVASLQRSIDDIQSNLRRAEAASPLVDQLTAAIANEENTLRTIKSQFESAVLSERSQTNFVDVRLISPAATSQKPNVSRLLVIILGFIASIVLAVMLAIISEYFDERTSDLNEIEETLGIPCVGTVSRGASLSRLNLT